MKHFYNHKYYNEKYNFHKVGDLLLNSKAFETNKSKKEKSIIINSRNGNILNKSTKYKSISFSDIYDNSKIKADFLSLSRNTKLNKIKKEIPFSKSLLSFQKGFNRYSHEDQKIFNENEKKAKTLLLKRFSLLEDDLYNLSQIYKKREINQRKIKGNNEKIISLPENNEEINFRKNINKKIKILKNIEKEKKLKKSLMEKAYYRLGEKEYQNIREIILNRDYDLDLKIKKDPFKKEENFYKKNLKRLIREYGFYPYNYLEEHKSIDPDAFKFIVNNFNSKFSLFGNAEIPMNKSKSVNKKINFPQTNKYSFNYIKRINRIKLKGEI